jgi:pyrimidine-nucleoside phosphorylase
MHIPSLIEKKRTGGKLSADEIRFLIESFTSGSLPDYQMSALAMAIYFQGMDDSETATLTDAMLHSGESLVHPPGHPMIVDKHSTGGVGDKVSLILTPLLACDGKWIPMISGRGLGITGGTLDKLESIPGFRCNLEIDEIHTILESNGCVITGQTKGLCPADRKLYALRDVTGTIPAPALIAASIMSKKLAESLDRLVLDVKFGSGAFMQTTQQARSLADTMLAIGRNLGVETRTVLTPMSEPLGHAVGNALELREAIETLQGKGPGDLVALVLDLATEVSTTSREHLAGLLTDGSALDRFRTMISAQGGDVESLDSIGTLHQALFRADVKAEHSGTLLTVDAGTVGRALLRIGAGRKALNDTIDFSVGADEILKTGTEVRAGDSLMRVHASSKESLAQAVSEIAGGIHIA